MKLSYDQNFFSFEFTSLDFTNPVSNRFLYKLEGVDEDWIVPGNDRTANYTHINSGIYLFRVKGSNADGIWNEVGTSVTIFIRPPFWSTWLFRIPAAIILIAFAANFYLKKTRKLQKEKEAQEKFSQNLIQSVENERKRIAMELHDGLGQNLLIIKNRAHVTSAELDNRKSNEEIKSIESLALESLNEIREIAYNLHPHQIDRLGITKAIESMLKKISTDNRIKFNYFLDDIDELIPKELAINLFRIIQEAITNIMNHSGASNASVVVSKKVNSFEINIEDDGKGFDIEEALSKRSLGIASLYERTKILKGELVIDSRKGSGTVINFTLNGIVDQNG